jgi:hypothetical protein
MPDVVEAPRRMGEAEKMRNQLVLDPAGVFRTDAHLGAADDTERSLTV